MQVWRRQTRGKVLSNTWTSSLVLSCPIDDEAAAAARRRRRAPPNPSVNQVAWTSTDSMVLNCLRAPHPDIFSLLKRMSAQGEIAKLGMRHSAAAQARPLGQSPGLWQGA